jgi:beta-lactamase class A
LPKGSKVSLRNLAEKMISVSDNSATDLLLFALGREKVEAMQHPLGIASPALNRPFLSTMEAFKLKGIPRLRSRWLDADERGRRMLLNEIDAASTSELNSLFQDGKPVAPDAIEWFFSPLDLARVMDWLRVNTTNGPAADARAILALNPGIGQQLTQQFNYVGYKGGSEPGLIHNTTLLQARSGDWFVLTAGWLNKEEPVEEGRFAALMSRATELVGDLN